MTLENAGEKREFTLGALEKEFTLTIKTAKPYSSLSIIANDQVQDQADSSTNSVALSLTPGVNLFDGINTYVIQGMGKESDELVATIVIYYKAPYVVAKSSAIKVIYYAGDPFMVSLINKIRTFLGRENIAGYFDFEGMSSAEDFEGKLASKDYDITVRGIDL